MRARLIVFFAVVLPLGIRAADAARGDSIDAATQQLNALKADANAAKAGTATGGLPVIAVPELHDTQIAPAPLVPNSVLEAEKKRKRAANWLVDGVMKPDPRVDDRVRGGQKQGRAGDRLLGDDSDRSDRTDPTAPTDRADARDRADSRAGDREADADDATAQHALADSVFNPLTRYMSDWLAPQDAAVLRQTLNAPAAGATGSSAAPLPATLPGGDASVGAALARFGADVGVASKPGYATPKPADNPYLEAMALPDVGPPPSANATMSQPVPAPAPSPVLQSAPVAPEPTRPSVPDFVKPLDDDKYYKPLKRF